jgi:hypothetical protein
VLSPGAGPQHEERFFRPGHALENVRDRMRLFAGPGAGVEVAGEGGQVRVSLVLAG